MATAKLSSIATASAPANSDTFIGVQGGTTDVQYTGTQINAMVLAAIQTTGTWTPIDSSGAALTFTSVNAGYTKIGNMVFAYASLAYPSTASGATALIGGLPFAVPNQTYARQGFVTVSTVAGGLDILPVANSTTISPRTLSAATVTNATLSTASLTFIAIYPVA